MREGGEKWGMNILLPVSICVKARRKVELWKCAFMWLSNCSTDIMLGSGKLGFGKTGRNSGSKEEESSLEEQLLKSSSSITEP
mmetsp:Transcript_3283/g.7651  ORF Transcript_3283/g.7651 Transcript_3283/m.7651 type:complete len:83 (+) Transcript_3283:2432-2680(+)